MYSDGWWCKSLVMAGESEAGSTCEADSRRETSPPRGLVVPGANDSLTCGHVCDQEDER